MIKGYDTNRIYYTGLWYSQYLFGNVDYLNRNGIQQKVIQTLDEIKTLCLLYDEIYIPRSHLLTALTDNHSQFLSAIINNLDFNWLTEHKIIVSSASPTVDSQGDTERIYSRTRGIDWLSNPFDSNCVPKISNISSIQVDSKSEADNSLLGYIQVSKWLEQNGNLHNISDYISRSEYKDISFFHEKFLHLIRQSDLPKDIKDSFWRLTNEVYLSNVGKELGDIMIPYNSIESKIPRNIGVDSRLLSAHTLKCVIVSVVGKERYYNWLNKRIDNALTFREYDYSDSWHHWQRFRDEYSGLILSLNSIIEKSSRIDDAEVSIEKVVSQGLFSLPSNWDVASDLIQDVATSLTDYANPGAGQFLKIGVKNLFVEKFVKAVLLRTKHSEISSFLKRYIF